ncbi:hypothetical protein LQ948_15735 [Jiella sp. MQZ9-1]|uniref:Uncharacterized protein n=1 Tax=Jiella flava TaxID=2816857 RepID=A0A939JY63_9HYPH|nr:hypothetical protein [Jiella flava]MBO0664086.1 hypothetical protein [Jiella flava]MCD2472657.1 hypothetical protein [Jiella flava]
MISPPLTALSAATVLAAFAVAFAPAHVAHAQDDGARDRGAGVILSEREREAAYPVQLPNGRIVYRTGSNGIPWLFGIGGVYGKASAIPLINGRTPSILASTPSAGIVPGQEPR